MRRDTLGFLSDCAHRYGDVVAFPVPGDPVLLLTAPEAVRQVMQAGHRDFGKRTVQYDTLALVTGRGLLTNDGDSWMRRRRLAQPAFHGARMAAVGDQVGSAVGRLEAEWSALPDGTVIDVDAAMMRVALEVVGRSLFSADFTEDADRLVAAVLESLDLVVARASSPFRLPLAVPTPRNLRMRRAVAVLDAAVEPLIRARRTRAEGPGDDLLGAYIAADDDGAALSDAEIRDEVVTLIVAGHETVASSLTWTWHLLGQHPDIADAVAAESARVAGERALSATDLRALDLTGRVVTESLRLFPPAWVVSRRALADVEVCGYSIPAGATLILSPYVTQRDRRNFADPEVFDPDRWCTAAGERFAYFPFGAGPNLCIGRDFALLEAVLIVATLAQRFRLEPQAGRAVRAEPLVTIRPAGGMPMRLKHRQQSTLSA